LHRLLASEMRIPVTTPDTELIERTVAGEAACFDVLIERHGGAVRQKTRSMVQSPADAEDLVQEALLNAWRALSAFRAEASFRTWLVRIAINEVLQERRRANWRFNLSLDDVDRLTSRGESPLETAEREATRRSLLRTIAGLPGKYRQVLVLCDLQEWSMDYAASRLGFGLPMLKSRLFRARRMLSNCYPLPESPTTSIALASRTAPSSNENRRYLGTPPAGHSGTVVM
jgi:RNA polymerase sigma-70 factor, ECF subfamily